MASKAFKPLVLVLALVAGVSVQTLALAADNESDGSRRIEVGFSPEGSAQKLVLSTIDAATSSIRVAAYVFTSPDVTRALIAAKQRGVDVAVIADYRSNLEDQRSGAGRHALTLLAKAGIPTRTIKAYPIHHDKFMVVDGMAVETGSFNFTAAAAMSGGRCRCTTRNPMLAHRAIAELSAIVPKLTLVTQNVDDLHERAGSIEVIHLQSHVALPAPGSLSTEAV